MSWHDAAARAALVALLALAGCGFRPLHMAEGAGDPDPALARVRVAPIPDRVGQQLAIALRDSFNPSGARIASPTHDLVVKLTTSRNETAIRTDGSPTRIEYVVYARFDLADIAERRSALSGTARSFEAFDVVENEYANLVASNDAQLRAVRDIAQEIRARVALFLTQ